MNKLFRTKRKTKRRKTKFLKICLSLIGLLLFIFGILLFSPLGEVQKIYISQNQEINNAKKLKTVLLSLKGKKLLLLNPKQIKQFLHTQIPNLKNLKIKKSYPNKLYILFDTFDLSFKINDNLYLDQTGTLIETNFQNAKQTPNLPELILTPNQNLKALDQVLNQEQVKRMQETLDYFKKIINLEIKQIEYKIIPKELHLKTPLGTKIWIDTTYDF